MSNTPNFTLVQSQPIAQLPQRMRSCTGWVWIGDVDVLAAIGGSSGTGGDGIAGEDLSVHGSDRGGGLVLLLAALAFVESGNDSGNAVGSSLGKNLGPAIDGLHRLVAHGFCRQDRCPAEQIDRSLFVHGAIVNQFTRLLSN